MNRIWRFGATPILWGFFLSTFTFNALVAAPLKPLLPQRLCSSWTSPPAGEFHARVLAIRVQFYLDTLSTTTGNGTFADHSWIPDNAVVDRPPHHRAYFEDHLRFLNNYFTEVSGGKATIDTFAVFPQADSAFYQLPHQMWHYNHNTTPADLNLRLDSLFYEAWSAAAIQDTAHVIHPENYNSFIIFHAGTGQDFALDYDQTPHDIPSAYFTLNDLQEAYGPALQGIWVNSAYVTHGLLLPEAERQTEVDMDIALNGTETLLFAHSLGLPALYNTTNGQTGVGYFDVMDQGSGNFFGMIPGRPCAWSRAFMGWETPYQIYPEAQDNTFWVTLSGHSAPPDTIPEIYRVDLNENEYYLIENRCFDPDSLGYTYAYDQQGDTLKINENYSVEVLGDDFGVIVRLDNYDFGVPGAGILIWHIDQSVIDSKYAQNQINTDPEHRGVDLVEADGAQDIGQRYGFFNPGYGTEYGWSRDFFYSGNEEFRAANPQVNTVTFYDDSHPGTRTYDDSPTGLRFDNFSGISNVMSFRVRNSWAQVGFPVSLAETAGSFSPSPLDLDFDEEGITDWILTVTPGGAVQAFDDSGRAQGDVIESRWIVSLLGDSTLTHDTLLARLDSIANIPAVYVTNLDEFVAIIPLRNKQVQYFSYDVPNLQPVISSIELDTTTQCLPLLYPDGADLYWYIGDDAGHIHAFKGTDEQWPNPPSLGGAILGLCLKVGTSRATFALTASDTAAKIDSSGNVLWTKKLPFTLAYPPIYVYHPFYPRFDLAAVGSEGEIALLNPEDGTNWPGFPINVGMPITAPPAAADFDCDGRLEVVLVGSNRIIGVAANGTLMANWPTILNASKPNQPILSSPAISQLNSNNIDLAELHVFFGWPDAGVDAFNRWGAHPDDFPRSTGSPVTSAPLLLQMDTDSKAELVALDENGLLSCWHLDLPGNYDTQRRPWNGLQNGNLRQGLAIDTVIVSPPNPSLLITSKVYPWPNPAREVSHIRYKMGQSGAIKVRIFDGAGDLVKELQGTSEAGLEGELLWDLTGVSSGVYLARVEAEAAGKTEKTFIKIAVVK